MLQESLKMHAHCSTVLFPWFQESTDAVAMSKHFLHVIRKAVEHVNPDHCPVVTFEQLLYALVKQIQPNWLEKYGDDKLVVMFGGLHIEMATTSWLPGSSWVEALVQAGISCSETADSFLKAAQVPCTRRAHQITAAALNVLQHQAYDTYCLSLIDGISLSFEAWCNERVETPHIFSSLSIVFELELLMLVFVQSLWVIFLHVMWCPDRTSQMVSSNGPYSLCKMDSSSLERLGWVAKGTPKHSSSIQSWQVHCAED